MNGKGLGGFGWPSLFVVLTGVYVYWASQNELVSSRPPGTGRYEVPEPIPDPGVRTIWARMWEDPLAAASADWRKRDRPTGLPVISDEEYVKLRNDWERETQAEAASAANGDKADGFGDAGDSEDDQSADDAPGAPKPAGAGAATGTTGTEGTSNQPILELRGSMRSYFKDLVSKNPILCVPVFVPGGPYAEDSETRMRIRYAVTMALAESRFFLRDSQRMSYAVPTIYVRVMRGWQQREIVVPVKLYDWKPDRLDQRNANDQADADAQTAPASQGEQKGKKEPNLRILVLWINESELGLRPLLATHRILHELFGQVAEADRHNLRVKIMGPASSDTLLKMLNEAKKTKAQQELQAKIEQDAKSIEGTLEKLAHARAADDAIGIAAKSMLDKASQISQQRSKTSTINVMRLQFNAIKKEAEAFAKNATTVEEQISEQISEKAEAATETLDEDGKHLEHWSIAEYKPLRHFDAEKDFTPLWDVDWSDDIADEKGAGEDGEAGEGDGKDDEKGDDEGDGEDDEEQDRIAIYSPRATVDFKRTEDSDVAAGWNDHGFFKLYRVVGTDTQLAQEIQAELKQRDALDGDIVLITETDTSYGRRIPQAFKYAFNETHDIAPEEGSGKRAIVTYHALRGVDGKLPDEGADKRPERRMELPAETPQLPDIAVRPPEGRSQYDYLRRLGRWIAENNENVAAVGVVGTDVYDKLLVLRAMRPHFPNSQFFTTDLDAIYSHPDELPHTRNLIVASHFGLTLEQDLQRRVAPFRDSYQTATFLATRLAVRATLRDLKSPESSRDISESWNYICDECIAKSVDGDWLTPLRYIVGRKQMHQLTFFEKPQLSSDGDQAATSAAKLAYARPEGAASILHPGRPPGGGGWHYAFSIGFAVLLGGCILVLVDRHRLSKLIGATSGEGNWPVEDAGASDGGKADKSKSDGRLDAPTRRRHMQFALNSLTACLGVLAFIGVGLLLWTVGSWVVETDNLLFAGHNVWPRCLLQVLTGILAAIALHLLIVRARARYAEGIDRCRDPHQGAARAASGDPLAQSAFRQVWSHALQATHVVKAVALGAAFVYTGIALVADLSLLWTLAIMLALLAAYVAAWRFCESKRFVYHTPSDKAVPGAGWVLGGSPAAILGCAAMLIVAVTLLSGLAESVLDHSHAGWHPNWTARGTNARVCQWLTTTYAFGMVGLLLSSFVLFLIWVREFDRAAKEAKTDDTDRLWFIAKLTSASGGIVPWLMALLLMLVLAYHPVLSPMAMPMGLLVLVTLSLVVFVVSVLSTRWHFDQERKQALAKPQDDPAAAKPKRKPEPEPTALLSLRPVGVPADPDAPPMAGQLEMALKTAPAIAPAPATETKTDRKQELTDLAEGVFQPWSKSPVGWLVGGGALLALADWWVRWWIIGL